MPVRSVVTMLRVLREDLFGWTRQELIDKIKEHFPVDVGVDEVMVARWEARDRYPTPRYRRALESVFGVPSVAYLGLGPSVEATLYWGQVNGEEEAQIIRRQFLKLALASPVFAAGGRPLPPNQATLRDRWPGDGVVLVDPTTPSDQLGVPAIRRALMDYELTGVLQENGAGSGMPSDCLKDLRRAAERAWTLRQASRYRELGSLLPRLIIHAESITRQVQGHDWRVANALLAHIYHAAVGMLKKLGEFDLAWIAADRSITAAERAEAPLLIAASAYRLGNVFLSGGLLKESQSVCIAALGALKTRSSAHSPEELSVRGGLLITAALAAARRRDREAAFELLAESGHVAERLGKDIGCLFAIFGPTEVAIYEVKTLIELGQPAIALRKARAIDTSRLPDELIEQRAYHLIDVARSHVQCRADASATGLLLEAERGAPEEVHYHAGVREIVRIMLHRERRSATPGLRGLATRVGVLA